MNEGLLLNFFIITLTIFISVLLLIAIALIYLKCSPALLLLI